MLLLDTESEVFALNTAATPPGFWPSKLSLAEQSKLYRRNRGAILGALARDLVRLDRGFRPACTCEDGNVAECARHGL